MADSALASFNPWSSKDWELTKRWVWSQFPSPPTFPHRQLNEVFKSIYLSNLSEGSSLSCHPSPFLQFFYQTSAQQPQTRQNHHIQAKEYKTRAENEFHSMVAAAKLAKEKIEIWKAFNVPRMRNLTRVGAGRRRTEPSVVEEEEVVTARLSRRQSASFQTKVAPFPLGIERTRLTATSSSSSLCSCTSSPSDCRALHEVVAATRSVT